MLRVGIIGVGNMGSKYARYIQDKAVEGFEIAALTRVGNQYKELLKDSVLNVPIFENADLLFEAVEKEELKLDAVIIATPHYAHEEQAVRAFKNGINVLSDKPAGVYSAQARRMNRAADEANKAYLMVFNQRTLPIYQRVKEIISSGKYGPIKRVNWTVTDWYRPEKYYSSSKWHATWNMDGGGVLLNQCPHNLDLLTWICGMPSKVQGFCHEGHFHNIEVEDDVTAYMEWENGATGTFISSTGDAPGVNRLEISLENAMLVCENGCLRIGEIEQELGMPESQYMQQSEDFFRKIVGMWSVEEFQKVGDPYITILNNFRDVCDGKDVPIADGREGINSLMLSNAIYLSSWENRMVDIPKCNSPQENVFELEFEANLKLKIN